jgi:hypothetical protein
MSKDKKWQSNLSPRKLLVEAPPPAGFWVTAKAWSLGGVLAIIVGSVHVWSMAGAGAGVASVLAALGIRLHRKRRGP